MGLEVTVADAYRVADTMTEASEWLSQEQAGVGDRLQDFSGMTGSGHTDQVVMFAVIRVLRRVAGVGYVVDGVARSLHAAGLDYNETDEESQRLFFLALQGHR